MDLGGVSGLARLLEAGAAVDGAAPLVITGAQHADIAAAAPPGAEVAENVRWEAGRSGGVDLARRLRPGLDLVIAPVDVPLVPPAVFAALMEEWRAEGSPPSGWLAPAFGGPPAKPGHPVLVGRELLSGMGALPPDAPLKLLRGRARPLWTVTVDAPEIHDDLDTPEDLERLRLRIAAD